MFHSVNKFYVSGPTYNLITSDTWGYNVTWMQPTRQQVSFRVRACADAHILLAQELHVVEENKVYEIVFGGSGNTVLYLRRGPLNNTIETVYVNNMVSIQCVVIESMNFCWQFAATLFISIFVCEVIL